MSADYTSYRIVSSGFTCNVCGQALASCNCNRGTLTGNGIGDAVSAGNFSISGGGAANITTTGYSSSGTFYLTCNNCGGPLGSCACQVNFPGTAVPNVYPNIITTPAPMPATWTGTHINRDEIYTYLKVLDVETKERYEHSGFFHVERKNEEDGIYGSISGLILPTELKDVFVKVRKEESFPLWQIRSPLVFQIDFQLDADKEESHYFTLVSVKDVQVGEKLMVITEARFQEVPNPIDLCQLIEIQRVFNKLLRRI